MKLSIKELNVLLISMNKGLEAERKLAKQYGGWFNESVKDFEAMRDRVQNKLWKELDALAQAEIDMVNKWG